MTGKKIKTDPMCDVSTNRIVIDDLNSVAMDAKFDFFRLIREDKNWFFLNRIADEILPEKNICSVRYMPFDKKGDTRSVFVMMTRDDSNVVFLNEYVRKKGNENCKVRKYSIDDMMQNWKRETIQLLLNYTKWTDIDGLRFNNVTGSYYCTNKAWSKTKQGFMALELNLEKEIVDDEESMVLQSHVRSFTRYEDAPESDEKPKSKLSQYILKTDDYTIHRAFNNNNNNYVKRQMPNRRSSIKYINLRNPKAFYKSKAYIMLNAVERFNMTFKGLIHINFDSWKQIKHESIAYESIKEFETSLQERIERNKFSIIDPVKDKESQHCLEEIVSLFKSEFGVDVRISDKPLENYLNLRIVHCPDFYSKPEDDPYKVYEGCVVHHVTIERYMKMDEEEDPDKSKKVRAKVIAKELFIKEDLMLHRISIDNWNKRGFNNDIVFAVLYVDEDDESEKRTVFRMAIDIDGSFDISITNENEPNKDKISKALFEASDQWGARNVEGAVMDHMGNINLICKTNIITVPEYSIIKIMKDNEKNNTQSEGARNDYSKNHVIHGNLDIRALMIGKEMHYFVGDLGDAPHKDTNAPNVRRIVPVEGSDIFFADIMDLMNVPFVKYNMTTVLPYPFKYLSEHVYLQKRNSRKTAR